VGQGPGSGRPLVVFDGEEVQGSRGAPSTLWLHLHLVCFTGHTDSRPVTPGREAAPVCLPQVPGLLCDVLGLGSVCSA
jgi:hypothetical protein